MVTKNTPHVWDKIWTDPGLVRNDKVILRAEAATKRWKVLNQLLQAEFGKLKGKRVIEIGSGIGTYAAIMSEKGAQATILDYSEEALKRAREFFDNNRLPVKMVKADALKLPHKLCNQFDVSISVGLAEHFSGESRLQIFKSHLDVLRPGGLAIISVPNLYNPPYLIFKTVKELLNRWEFGEEYPFTRNQLRKITNQLRAKEIALFGDDLYGSLKFILPANFLRRFFKVDYPKSIKDIRMAGSTPLDDYLAYSLTLVIKKV